MESHRRKNQDTIIPSSDARANLFCHVNHVRTMLFFVVAFLFAESQLRTSKSAFDFLISKEKLPAFIASSSTGLGSKTQIERAADAAEAESDSAPTHLQDMTKKSSANANFETDQQSTGMGDVTTSIQEDEEYKEKPWLILHIGPPKTGSTSIQCGLHKYSKELADLDKFYYMGNKCDKGDAVMPNNETFVRTAWMSYYMNGNYDPNIEHHIEDDVLPRIAEHRRQGHNVIISGEHFFDTAGINDPESWNRFKNLSEGFQFKAIMVNRILLDWIPSFYFQAYRSSEDNIPTFLSFLDGAFKVWTEGKLRAIRFGTGSVNFLPKAEAWHSHFSLDIMDFHSTDNDGDIFHNLVCQYLPNATKTCNILNAQKEELRKAKATSVTSKTGVIHANPGGSLDVQRIFAQAKKDPVTSRYINSTSSLKEKQGFLKNAKKVLMGVLSATPEHFYHECISLEASNTLKNVSSHVMQRLLEMKTGKSIGDAEIKSIAASQEKFFQKNLVSGKYCDLDVEKLFMNDTIVSKLVNF
jgi:hypothetical protein